MAAEFVLVVDDDANIREFIRLSLEDEGYEVSTAANGLQALDSVAESQPALVLLDLQMPVMNGWQLQVRLRDEHSTIPVVFMSAIGNVADQAALHGAAGSLAKPFGLQKLLELVARFGPCPPP